VGTVLKRRRSKQPDHPSIYFFIALGIGIAALIILFVTFLRNPPKVQPAPKRSAHVTARGAPTVILSGAAREGSQIASFEILHALRRSE
jgi:hypothetical protein